MKIAILGTRGIPARYGGFETFADEISQRLVQQGVAVTVFCEAGEGDQPGEYRGVHLEYVAAPKLGPLSTIVFDLLCLWRTRKGYDVVYMLGYGASLFCFIPRLFGSKVWINMDGLEWARSKWSWPARIYLKIMEGIAMWTPNLIIADADAIRENLAMRYRYMPECEVITYGAQIVEQAPDAGLLAEWVIEPGGYYLVVCRLEPENHVLEIMQGFAASGSTLPLIVLGDHRCYNDYVAQLHMLQSENIRLIGTVYDQEKLRALRYHCHAYFHGHSVGGTNPSLLEALGCGNAVIAHDNPFNHEVAGTAACYFASGDTIPALVTQMEADQPRRMAMRRRAREIIAERYTWEKVTKHYLQLLNSHSRKLARSAGNQKFVWHSLQISEERCQPRWFPRTNSKISSGSVHTDSNSWASLARSICQWVLCPTTTRQRNKPA